ncbi:MAG: non-heme iron oxygenase ferredoxin subunit [Myxococcales bacterium]|nr:MAG: non-heme iron oxygenase ferredoxin subunit [Myxococcales bacterium]
MSWKRAIPSASLPPGTKQSVKVSDEKLLIGRSADGLLFAVENLCTHDDGPLAEGELDGRELVCPRHGARFDIKTGAALCLPATAPLTAFPIRENEDGWIEVNLEE